MKIGDVRSKAKDMGLKTTPKMKKSEIIKAIQVAEGNTPCFGISFESCGQDNCCWREDCISEK